MQPKTKISVLGDGGWGTTLSLLLHKKGFSVSIWSAFNDYAEVLKNKRENIKFLPGFKIPASVHITSDIDEALVAAEAIIIAIPTQFLRGVMKRLKKRASHVNLIVSVVKGIETMTFKRPSEIAREEAGLSGVAVLSGPTIAHEVANGLPTSCVVASSNHEHAKKAQELLMSEKFRIYTSDDVIGVELGGALKNIIAIAAGISDGLSLGTNAKSALFTRGLVEMKRLGVMLGAKEETFNGLSGIGDLLTTCISPYSRNRHVGEEIAKGKNLSDILKKMEMVAEGIETTRSVYELSKKIKVDTPITEEVYKVLFEGKSALSAVSDLMRRSKKAE
jgi:glycerol-3-phosphate dehydrogenase (NAD(P)+)